MELNRSHSVQSFSIIVALVVGLSSCGAQTSENTDVSTTTLARSTTTTSSSTTSTTSTSTTTTTTIPEAVDVPLAEVVELGDLTVHIEKTALDLRVTQDVVNAIDNVMDSYPLLAPADAILFSSGSESLLWAQSKSRELDCLYSSDINRYSSFIGWGNECGLLMRVDGMTSGCPSGLQVCKSGATVGVHEFFHVITAQILEPCSCRPLVMGNKLPNWYNEGTADFVGYVSVFGSDQKVIDSLIELSKSNARMAEIDVDLVEIEGLWAQGMEQPWWFGRLYERSFLAALLLVDQYGEQAVLSDYFYAVTLTGNYNDAFELTFGKSIEEFSDEFEVWLADL